MSRNYVQSLPSRCMDRTIITHYRAFRSWRQIVVSVNLRRSGDLIATRRAAAPTSDNSSWCPTVTLAQNSGYRAHGAGGRPAITAAFRAAKTLVLKPAAPYAIIEAQRQ